MPQNTFPGSINTSLASCNLFFLTWKHFFVGINKSNQLPFLFVSQEEKPSYPPRLFQCSNASGAFRVEEIFEFCQEVNMSICFLFPYRLVFIHVVLLISIDWFSCRTLSRTMLCSWTLMTRYTNKILVQGLNSQPQKGAFYGHKITCLKWSTSKRGTHLNARKLILCGILYYVCPWRSRIFERKRSLNAEFDCTVWV